MTKITNREARDLIIRKETFTTGNKTLFAKYFEERTNANIPPLYIVYSYGEHFPMWVYDYGSGNWYGNQDKYSRTTSKHQSITRPPNIHQWFDTETLKRVINMGLSGVVAHRMS